MLVCRTNRSRSMRRSLMPILGGMDIHRKQITFDYLDVVTGEVRRGQIAPADRQRLRAWLGRFDGVPDVAFAPVAHAHSLIVLTLAGAKISAITRFGDNDRFPASGCPGPCPASRKLPGHDIRLTPPGWRGPFCRPASAVTCEPGGGNASRRR